MSIENAKYLIHADVLIRWDFLNPYICVLPSFYLGTKSDTSLQSYFPVN